MRLPLLILSLLVLTTPAHAQQEPLVSTTEGEAAPPPARIELETQDSRIAARLRGLFAEIEGLGGVKAEVNGGVVSLRGTVLSVEDGEEAEAVARRLAGVVTVENGIAVERRLDRRLRPMAANARDIAGQVIGFLPLLVIALLVFLGFWILGRLVTRKKGPLQRIAPNPLVQTLVAQVARLIFMLVGLILAMRIMGATALLGSVLGAAGVIGIAVGFAVRDTIENYIASILLSIRRPFDPNDHVIIDGYEGLVTRLNSRATFLTSFDGSELRLPNAIVYKAKITNFTQIPERRFEFDVGVGHENDLCQALATALEAVKSVEGVLASPEPAVLVDALEPSTVTLKVLGWVNQRSSDFGKVRSAAIRAVKTAFDTKAISMPAPIQSIRLAEEAARNTLQTSASPAEMAEIDDTRRDPAIQRSVETLRAKGEEDLLTAGSPRE